MFCSANLHLVKERQWTLLGKRNCGLLQIFEIIPLQDNIKTTLSYLKNDKFVPLDLCYLNYKCSKKKTDQNVFFLKVGKTRFFDNCKYVSSPKSYTLQSHITTSGKKSVVSPSIPNACMLSKFIHFQVRTMCVLVFPVNLLLAVLKSKCVHSDINVIS